MTTLPLALAFATRTTGDTGTPADTGAAAATPADTASGGTGMADSGIVTAAGLAGEAGGLGCDTTRGSVRLAVLVGLVLGLRRRGRSGEGAP